MLVSEGHPDPLDTPLVHHPAHLRRRGVGLIAPQAMALHEAFTLSGEQGSSVMPVAAFGDRTLVGIAGHQEVFCFAAHGDPARRSVSRSRQ